ncbi:MAG: SdiA-regulated domain-containing protein [Parcubacteria group bacterium]|jgi:hypothetical protein
MEDKIFAKGVPVSGKKIKITILGVIIFFIASPWHCLAINSWPGGSGTTIATYSDASGAVWHEGRQSLFVVRNTGTLIELNSNGTELNSWPVAGDLEGITLAEDDRYLYIGIENPDSIVEFDLGTGELSGKSWTLTTWMTGPDNSGLEGLAYRDGYFLAGLQADGKIYVFDVNLNASGDVDYAQTITPDAGYSDISGIDYNADTGISYAIFDASNALVELNGANEAINHYSLPGSAQEGFAMKANCLARKADVYITNDDNGQIVKYTEYPVTCLDADKDGKNYNEDCNDYDAGISSNRMYYPDADGDGLGASAPASFCSLTAPAGYVADNTDRNDSDFDNDGYATSVDCNDSNSSIFQFQTYYRDADSDGLGSDETTSVCSFTIPPGYAANSNDQNDGDFDNDGSSAGSDCDESDNSISQKQTYYRDADSDGLGDANIAAEVCSPAAPEGYAANSDDPADIFANGRLTYVNGGEYPFFTVDPLTAQYADANFYGDEYHEIIAVGLIKKRAYITLARVWGSNVTIVKRVMLKKKYKTAQIILQITKRKFITRFNGKKKYTWKVNSSGSFKKSR